VKRETLKLGGGGGGGGGGDSNVSIWRCVPHLAAISI